MKLEMVVKQDGEPGTGWKPEYVLTEQRSIWPDLVPSKEYFPSNSCHGSRCDQSSSKALEAKGLLHQFSLHDHSKSDGKHKSRAEDLYRYSGPERTNNRAEHVVSFEDYEARIKNLEARLIAQTEKLERLIAAQVSHDSTVSTDPTDNNNYSNRPTNLARPADGAHYVFDRSGNGQLVGPSGEHQYNLINGERVWLKDSNTPRASTNDCMPQVTSGCSNGSCGSCSSCRPRPRMFR